MDFQNLKEAVTKLLCGEFDMLPDEAEDIINNSVDKDPDMWNENADPRELANYLASDENED